VEGLNEHIMEETDGSNFMNEHNPSDDNSYDKEKNDGNNGDSDSTGDNDNNNELPIPENAYAIEIAKKIVIFVDHKTGTILGPKAEGTLGIILYGQIKGEQGLQNARAIRIPRLLSSDILVNFHIAEISNCEGIQAEHFCDKPGLLGSHTSFRLDRARTDENIPGHKDNDFHENTFLGFYLSPKFKYSVCLISKEHAWPKNFESYIKSVGKSIPELFTKIENYTKGSPGSKSHNQQHLDNLIFFPDYGSKDEKNNLQDTTNKSDPISLSRERLHLINRERNASGWWFNLPVAVYTWMTADLQRLLTAIVNVDEKQEGIAEEIKLLREWTCLDWFKMFYNLALGFLNLHTGGAIHGDPRPANIMINVPENGNILLPENFFWIDIGLGYEVSVIHDEKGRTSITPRPLGGSRTTPFYAPERIEGNELEDADHIKLIKQGDKLILKFYFKHKTDQELNILRLMEGDRALRELGTLHEGDRIQVREFLFVVEKVRDMDIVVSKIYEIVLDRVLIDVSVTEKFDDILAILKSCSISRYRLFKHWSQATDIYGLGQAILYAIFMRGFFKKGIQITSIKNKEKQDVGEKGCEFPVNPLNQSLPADSIFMGLSQTLRSKTFLVSVLTKITENLVEEKESIWDKEILNTSCDLSKNDTTGSGVELSKRITNIANQIRSFDYNFDYILKGLDNRIGLLVQIVYFCLCCLWREDEWSEIKSLKKFSKEPVFEPFCISRIKNHVQNKQDLPANKAKKYLEKLRNNVANMSKDHIDKSGFPENDIQISDDKLEYIERLISQNEELNKKLENEKEENSRFRKSKSDFDEKVNQRVSKILETNIEYIKKYYETRKRSPILNFPLVKLAFRDAEEYLRKINDFLKNELNAFK